MNTGRSLGLSALLGIAACASCTSDSTSGSTANAEITQTVDIKGGTVELSTGAQVVVPTGAVEQPTAITVGNITNSVLKSQLPANTDYAGASVAFKPHGATFNVPVHVQLPIDHGANCVLRLANEKSTSFEEVGEVEFAEGKANFDTKHFSVYVGCKHRGTDGGAGGALGTGGAHGSGGALGGAGAAGLGGRQGVGGTTGSGGTVGTGGTAGTAGAASGGTSGTAGTASGGTAGTAGTGAASGTGGTAGIGGALREAGPDVTTWDATAEVGTQDSGGTPPDASHADAGSCAINDSMNACGICIAQNCCSQQTACKNSDTPCSLYLTPYLNGQATTECVSSFTNLVVCGRAKCATACSAGNHASACGAAD